MNSDLLSNEGGGGDDSMPDWAHEPSADEKKAAKAEQAARKAERKAAKEAQKRLVRNLPHHFPPKSSHFSLFFCKCCADLARRSRTLSRTIKSRFFAVRDMQLCCAHPL